MVNDNSGLFYPDISCQPPDVESRAKPICSNVEGARPGLEDLLKDRPPYQIDQLELSGIN